MRVLLTGADGFVGSNVTRELLRQGYQVVAFVEAKRDAATIKDLPVEIIKGDLLDGGIVNQAAASCQYIIHLAANTNIQPAKSEIIRRVNIEGTRHVIAAALAHNIKRMVYVGTANTFGFGSKDNPGDETRPYASAKYGLDYMDSKYEAHQTVLNAVKENNLPCVIVNPTFMFGPYDTKPSSGAMILAIKDGKIPGYTSGGRNYIAVKNVATGIVNALKKGRIGEAYVLGNHNLSYKEVFRLIAQTIGVKPPAIGLPPLLTKAYGRINEIISKVTGNSPVVSYPMALIACDEHYFSARKAVEELDLPQAPLEEAIQEAFEWLQANGFAAK